LSGAGAGGAADPGRAPPRNANSNATPAATHKPTHDVLRRARRRVRTAAIYRGIPARPAKAAGSLDLRSGVGKAGRMPDRAVVQLTPQAEAYDRKVRLAKKIVMWLAAFVGLSLLTAMVFGVYSYVTDRPAKELFTGPSE
jgi:hypothetical protein